MNRLSYLNNINDVTCVNDVTYVNATYLLVAAECLKSHGGGFYPMITTRCGEMPPCRLVDPIY